MGPIPANMRRCPTMAYCLQRWSQRCKLVQRLISLLGIGLYISPEIHLISDRHSLLIDADNTNYWYIVAPGSLANSGHGCIGLESRCGRYLSLVHTCGDPNCSNSWDNDDRNVFITDLRRIKKLIKK